MRPTPRWAVAARRRPALRLRPRRKFHRIGVRTRALSRGTFRSFVGVTERGVSGAAGSARALIDLLDTLLDTTATRLPPADRLHRLGRFVLADAATTSRFFLGPALASAFAGFPA